MWSWLPKNVRRRIAFWGRLILFSSMLHTVFLFFLFVVYKGETAVYTVNIKRSILKSGVPIIFMPLKKVVGKSNLNKNIVVNKTSVLQKQASKKKKIIKQSAKKKVSAKKKAVSVVSKPKKKTTVKKKSVPEKKSMPKKLVKKKILRQAQDEREKPTPKKKRQEKEIENKKKELQKKSDKQKEKPKDIKQEKRVVEKKIAEKETVKKHISAEKKEKVPIKEKNHQPIVQESVVPKQEAIYIGRHELDALYMEQAIKDEVSKHWRPPLGLPKDLLCTINVLVGWDGSIKNVVVSQSSGVLMYDISARNTLSKLELPRWSRGKEIKIIFNQ